MTQLNNQSKSALHAVFGDNTSFYLAKTSVALTFELRTCFLRRKYRLAMVNLYMFIPKALYAWHIYGTFSK